MKYTLSIPVILIITSFTSSCTKENNDQEQRVIINAAGDIHDEVDNFRHLLGDQLNTTIGVTGGRREINWDGVPDSLVGSALPANFFNPVEVGSPVGRQRGLAYVATGEFRVSNNNFAEVNLQAAGQFAPFSGNKSFANISSNKWEVGFEVPGEATAAAVKGFAVVLSDVDLPNSTSLEFFNGVRSLGKFFVKPHDATTSFSFFGIYFHNNEQITKVSVSHDGILSDAQKDISDNGSHDLVVLDDFFYSEPVRR